MASPWDPAFSSAFGPITPDVVPLFAATRLATSGRVGQLSPLIPTQSTLYIIGDVTLVTGTVTPVETTSWIAELWGAGAAGNETTGAAGLGAGWARKASFAVTSGTPLSFSLGVPGLTGGAAGGDSWLITSGTLLANGGGSVTARIGDNKAAGGGVGVPTVWDAIFSTEFGTAGIGTPGGGGAGGPGGGGQSGGTVSGVPGGAGGGGAGGGTVGGTSGSGIGATGGAGPQGPGGTGGADGVHAAGTLGGPGGGGGGGFGDGITHGSGGPGGDDYDNGGGGAGGAGAGAADAFAPGAPGGTPGGGGSAQSGTAGPGRGGLALIKISFSGMHPDLSLIGGGSFRLITPDVGVVATRRMQRFRPRRPGRGPMPLIPDSLRDVSPAATITQIAASTRLATRPRAAPVGQAPEAARSALSLRGTNAGVLVVPPLMMVLTPALLNATAFQDDQQDGLIGPNDFRAMVDTLASMPTAASSPQTTSYTAAFADYGCVVEFTGGGAQNFTIPANVAVSFGIGATLWACQMGTGTVTFVADIGVTLRAFGTPVTAGQYCTIGVRKRAANEWVFVLP